MLSCHLITLSRLNVRILPVSISDLHLNELHLRVFCQDPVQHIRFIMHGKSNMADEPFLFSLLLKIPDAVIIKKTCPLLAKVVKQIEIKVSCSASSLLLPPAHAGSFVA